MGTLIIRDTLLVVFGAVVGTWCADRVLLLLGCP
jgi:hypothetical protein